MPRFAYYPCPFGYLELGWDEDFILSACCTDRIGWDHCPSPVSDLAAAQYLEYFRGVRREFDFPMAPAGTPFQASVREALLRIPYGQTRSYARIAAAMGKPGAARAVGMACRRNPIWIAIPCHRVVGQNAALTGYAGGLAMKQALLNLEQNNSPE